MYTEKTRFFSSIIIIRESVEMLDYDENAESRNWTEKIKKNRKNIIKK